MHLILPPGPAMRDGAHSGVKLCCGAWKRGQDNHVGMFSLYWSVALMKDQKHFL